MLKTLFRSLHVEEKRGDIWKEANKEREVKNTGQKWDRKILSLRDRGRIYSTGGSTALGQKKATLQVTEKEEKQRLQARVVGQSKGKR